MFLFQTLFVCCSFVCPEANPKYGLVCTSFSCPIMNIHLILCLNESYSMSHQEDIRSYFTSTMQFICWTNIFQNIFLVRKIFQKFFVRSKWIFGRNWVDRNLSVRQWSTNHGSRFDNWFIKGELDCHSLLWLMRNSLSKTKNIEIIF